jgi:integrase
MRWYLTKDKAEGQWVIRGGEKNSRLPLHKYSRIRQDEAALRELVKRLNAPADVKLKVSYKHAFISPALLDDYLRYLKAQIPSESGAKQEYSYLRRHFLDYFIGKLDLMNPLDWHRVHETQWAEYLLSPLAPKAAKTKRDIIIAANRFMGWLHKQRPEEVPPLEFKPLSKAKFKDIEANREFRNEIKERTHIEDSDWKKIEAKLPESIRPFVLLAYYYGLRRSEALGVHVGDVKKDFLAVSSQLVRLRPETKFKPLKGKDARRVPHWLSRAPEAYQWVLEAAGRRINPSTLTHRWNEFMDELGLDYDFHELRHSFITKTIRKYPPRDVQLAAGHKDIRTTMRYAHDDRALNDEPFNPEAA